MGVIPSWGAKIPGDLEQQSLHATTTEACMPQLEGCDPQQKILNAPNEDPLCPN